MKRLYVTPSVEVTEIKSESVITVSGYSLTKFQVNEGINEGIQYHS